VLNDVKQGGIINLILLCDYIHDLLMQPAKSEVGCFIGTYLFNGLLNFILN